jgi:cyclopropane fatty-acyl-phospholipid synthase-like methyltransferase
LSIILFEGMNEFFKGIYQTIKTIKREEIELLKLIKKLNLSQQHTILDVGCGYGRYMWLLKEKKYNVIGVDANSQIIIKNVSEGLPCITIEELDSREEQYDLIIMSHIIEHFSPLELLDFVDRYLDRLKDNGYIIIATPLFSKYFYDDFDHVKPYHPIGIDMIFGNKSSQVQFHSKHYLELQDIWFRRESLRIHFCRGLYIPNKTRVPKIINFLLACLFRISFGWIGKVDGWIGLYKKCSPRLKSQVGP